MSFEPGTRLGNFEILSTIGSGGMGDVYKARDLELGRKVVIKTIRPDLATSTRRLQRFRREARAASALNHPNIVTVHGFGEHNGAPYIVMEYVAGRTLREELSGGPLSIRRLTRYALQISKGLAKAHRAGIVHRDLKPDNIIISDDGYVKIVDFGIAKLLSPLETADDDAPAEKGTVPGAMLGTIGYMSPEQIQGGYVDTRSDQFAFGAVVYEMATGRRPFHAASRSEAIAAVVKNDPTPLAELRPDAPEALCRIVHRCLEKDPDNRFDSIRDLREDLKTPALRGSARRRGSRTRALMVAGVVAAVVLLAALLTTLRPGGERAPVETPQEARARAPLPESPQPAPPPVAVTTTTAPPPRPVAPPRERAPEPPPPDPEPSQAPPSMTPPSVPSQAEAGLAPPSPEPRDDEADIRESLALFERAIESQNLSLYRQVKPNTTSEERRRLEASFDNVDSHELKLEIGSIVIEGDAAKARVTRTDVIVVRGQPLDPTTREQTFELTRTAGKWFIVKMGS